LNLDISDRDDPNIRNKWFARYEITDNWQLIKIPFDQLSYLRSGGIIKKEGFKPGKQILDMTACGSINIWNLQLLGKRGNEKRLYLD
jgi:hypothetical protein